MTLRLRLGKILSMENTNTNGVKTVKVTGYKRHELWYAGCVGQTFRVTEFMGKWLTEEVEIERVQKVLGKHSAGRATIEFRDSKEVL